MFNKSYTSLEFNDNVRSYSLSNLITYTIYEIEKVGQSSYPLSDSVSSALKLENYYTLYLLLFFNGIF